MRISSGATTIEVQSFPEKSDLLKHLQAGGTFTLFESSEQAREFYSVVIHPNFINTNVGKTAMGICSEGHGISPELLPIPENHLILIGFDEKVVAINPESGNIVLEHQLRSLFWSFVQLPSGQILVFYEIGVKALDKDAHELWDYNKDLLKSADLDQTGVLTLLFSDCPPIALNLATGQVVNH